MEKVSQLIYSPDSYSWTQSWDWSDSYFSLARQPREELNDDCGDKWMSLPNCTMETGYTYCYVSVMERKRCNTD